MKSVLKICLFLIGAFLSLNLFANNKISESNNKPQKVLFIISSDSHGFYMSETIEPYQLLQEAGYGIDIASPKGGQNTPSGTSRLSSEQKKWFESSSLKKQLQNTLILEDVKSQDYVALYYPGGAGPMFDLPQNKTSQEIARNIYEAGGLIAADCHGPAALLNVELSDSSLLVKGRNITAKANKEEGRWARNNYPFLLEDQFNEIGANFSTGSKNTPHVVVDGQLITGQNPASAILMAEKLITKLKQNKVNSTK